MTVRPKDYLVANDQLYFAVVAYEVEQGRAQCYLRYIKDEGSLGKLGTRQAQTVIREQYPEYQWHSESAAIELHGIPLADSPKQLKPEETVSRLRTLAQPSHIQADALQMISLFESKGLSVSQIGITGSLMLGVEHETSDIDMVIYGRNHFFTARETVKAGIGSGELGELSENDWRENYQRRDCSISFAEYCYYEKRKWNKCLSGNTRVDISMIQLPNERLINEQGYRKLKRTMLQAKVMDDRFAYDFPARFKIDHDSISEILCFTATYTGQAVTNESIEASGVIEYNASGQQRFVVGTSREAEDEYIRVMK